MVKLPLVVVLYYVHMLRALSSLGWWRFRIFGIYREGPLRKSEVGLTARKGGTSRPGELFQHPELLRNPPPVFLSL